ncbi:probable aspartic proteinase GIP2 [Impatiens glandulifera]|uniref:probable aspartic proteinase GIP2 n=1 Tax=Impatiens glandulifera TaxID=253017 RepID=UPI001FB0ED9A|nr:probable aspartic proteinase GIP2 [Impatiens glandulifera]
MALFVYLSLIFLIYQYHDHPTVTAVTYHPRSVLIPVTKDPKALQYLTQIKQRTPLVPLTLVLDLGGQSLWVDCESDYISSSYRSVHCGSPLCKLSPSRICRDCSPVKPGCSKNFCSIFSENTATWSIAPGELATDLVSFPSTNGVPPARLPFNCGPTYLLEGLAEGVKGMVGLGLRNLSISTQLAVTYRFPRTFAMCLASSKGVVLFGHGPYSFLPGIDMSKRLTYTPLIINPVSTASAFFEGDISSEYFMHVRAIKFNGREISINKTRLIISKDGRGGTKFSNMIPYTTLERSIYKAVTAAFGRFMKVARVKAVKPFSICYNSSMLGVTRVGYAVPQIELVLPGKSSWLIFGANSLMNVKKDVVCFAFIDGGLNPVTSIVIGGYQLEDNLLQFDLGKLRIGFSSSLLFYRTTCANFNFSSSTISNYP